MILNPRKGNEVSSRLLSKSEAVKWVFRCGVRLTGTLSTRTLLRLVGMSLKTNL